MIFRTYVIPPVMPQRQPHARVQLTVGMAIALLFAAGLAAWAGIIYTAWGLWHLLTWSLS